MLILLKFNIILQLTTLVVNRPGLIALHITALHFSTSFSGVFINTGLLIGFTIIRQFVGCTSKINTKFRWDSHVFEFSPEFF